MNKKTVGRDEMEVLIEERTHELKRVNRELSQEIERRRVIEQALRTSEAQYRGLVDRVPVGVYRTTVDGRILEVNPALVRMLGYDNREQVLLQSVFQGYVDAEEREKWRREIELRGVVRDFELQLYRADGSIIWVRDTGRAVLDDDGQILYYEGVMEDVTESKRARERLQRAFERLHELESVVNRSPAVFFRWGIDLGWPVMFVTQNVDQFGYSGSDFMSGAIQWLDVLDPDDVKRLDALVRHYLDDGVTEFELQFKMRLASRMFHWVEARVFVVRTTGGTVDCIEGLIVDIDQRRRLEQQMAEISEHERQRIGRDLHDVLGQSLTGTAFFIKAVQNKLANGEHLTVEEMDKIAGMINDAISQTRMLARGLCPVDLEGQGLVRGLKELAVGIDELYGVECVFSGPPDEGEVCDHAFALALFHIAQESVNNAVRHGEPSRIEIRLVLTSDRIELVVADNGLGFDAQAVPGNGLGLSLMQYRAEGCGAWFEIESVSGRGTTVRCIR